MSYFFNPTEEFMRQLEGMAAGNDDDAQKELEAIDEGSKRPSMVTLYDTRSASSLSQVNFFLKNDKVEVGLRNVESAKIENDMYFMPYAILVEGAFDAATPFNDDNMGDTAFKPLHKLDLALENGEMNLHINGSAFLNQFALATLNRQTGVIVPEGAIFLPATEIIKPSQRIKAEYLSPEKHNVPDNVALKVTLFGIGTSPKSN